MDYIGSIIFGIFDIFIGLDIDFLWEKEVLKTGSPLLRTALTISHITRT